MQRGDSSVADTIKEFLVAIGFDVDENSFGKFETRLGKATAGALELGSVVTATAVAVEAAVAKMARQFEDLFYVSQRTGSAVRALQGFDYAARTIGVTSDQARGAVEGLARAMRTNPGIGALLNQLGVSTHGRGTVEILNDVIGQLKKMPFYLAAQYGQTLGIDPDTLLMLIQRFDELQRARADYDKRQKEAGVDAKKLSEESRNFNNVLRSLETTLSLIRDRILQNFIGPATKMVELVDELARKFIEIDKATNGWASTLTTVGTTALAAWIAKLLLAKVLFRSVTAEAATAAAAGGGGAGAAAGAAGAAGGAAALAGGASGASTGLLGLMALGLGGIKYDLSHGNRARTWLRSKLGIKDDAAGDAVNYFISQGWTRAQATGIVTNLDRESHLNPKAVGDRGEAFGAAQWHRDRQENFRRAFGKDIRDSTLEEQLQFVQMELTTGTEKAAGNLLKRAGSPEEAAAVVSKFYERPANAEGEASSRAGQAKAWYDSSVGAGPSGGDKNVTINSKTDVHVQSTDPKQAGREVAGAQDDVAVRAARYAGTAVR